ncbi:hypothetical protein FisN_4Lh030 [Fistulifera solaris]|uniref:Uncharacterized protein n=1 Tax=Fistulifera solaris TaxID=1519565 RepID=A0A1Z5KDJ7_FISSO|nr:hypothetical protein FisN_4Lh030 [Fistulifera solaris]|eukprot:GAX24266.1 hypothetical protein FisN_4Lh030 [Fistulifera solaris]
MRPTMTKSTSRKLILLLSFLGTWTNGFLPSAARNFFHCQSLAKTSLVRKASTQEDPTDELSEERKASLFQFLLRDLQIEGVPLLEVDADRVHILQAAIWTTMAEMSTQSDEQKTCLIFEAIPITALRAFVDDFMILKAQDRLMTQVSELRRFNLLLVGKGVGPAILIEASAQKDAAKCGKAIPVDVDRSAAVMKMFVDRMVAEKQVSGYPSSNGSVAQNSVPSMSFPACPYTDACHILSSFWNQVCEILAYPGELRSSMLLLPGVESGNFPRFSAIAELISRSLCLYRVDDALELLHFHPMYDRAFVFPEDMPAHGHIPPISWLKPMLQFNGYTAAAQDLSDDEVRLINYIRRSPISAVCVVPVDLWMAALGPEDGVVHLEIGGVVQQASGVSSYSRNVLEASEKGESVLREALSAETAILM